MQTFPLLSFVQFVCFGSHLRAAFYVLLIKIIPINLVVSPHFLSNFILSQPILCKPHTKWKAATWTHKPVLIEL